MATEKERTHALRYEDIQRIVQEEMERITSEVSEDAIRELVRENVKLVRIEQLRSYLGLTHKWGRWEVDHNTNSPAFNAIKMAANKAASAIVENLTRQTSSLPARLEKVVLTSYMEQLERCLVDAAHKQAKADAGDMLEKALAGAGGPVVFEQFWRLFDDKP